jgi:hypothetical protein
MTEPGTTKDQVSSQWVPQYPEDRAELILGGQRYRWQGWYGCQLMSIERRRIHAGETREIAGRTFTVFRSTRLGLFRFETTWSLPAGGTHEHHDNRVRQLKHDLQRLV